MKFSIKNFFNKCDQIRRLHFRISLMENLIFCAVYGKKLDQVLPIFPLITIYKAFLSLHLDYSKCCLDQNFNNFVYQRIKKYSI